MNEAGELRSTFGPPPLDTARLSELYWKYFKVLDADTPELRMAVHRLRYQVYCVEHSFESPNSTAIEVDSYDDHSSLALLIQQRIGLPAGTVRMVLPISKDPEKSFAFQELCTDSAIRNHRYFPIDHAGEISRFCVSKQFRQ
jgi:N-acyl amino acid synthase of PEP-CTERM/exosortase system